MSQPISEKNRRQGVPNTKGSYYKRKEAAHKRSKYVRVPASIPPARPVPEPHVVSVARASDAAVPLPSADTGAGVFPKVDSSAGAAGPAAVPVVPADGGVPAPPVPQGELAAVHADIGLPDAPRIVPLYRPRHVCHSSHDNKDEVVERGRLWYNFIVSDVTSDGRVSELLSHPRVLLGGGIQLYLLLAGVGLLLAGASYWYTNGYTRVLLALAGAIITCGSIASAPFEFRRTLDYRHVRFDRDHPKSRVFQDQSRDPTLPYTTFVNISVNVDFVYWDGTSWQPLHWILDWLRCTLFEFSRIGALYMPRQIEVPHHLWASIIAAISRLADRSEEQVQISVDQAVRSMRPHLTLQYQLELAGLTGDLSVASMHAYRAMKYRNLGNWTLAH